MLTVYLQYCDLPKESWLSFSNLQWFLEFFNNGKPVFCLSTFEYYSPQKYPSSSHIHLLCLIHQDQDIILFRTKEHSIVFASLRTNPATFSEFFNSQKALGIWSWFSRNMVVSSAYCYIFMDFIFHYYLIWSLV